MNRLVPRRTGCHRSFSATDFEARPFWTNDFEAKPSGPKHFSLKRAKKVCVPQEPGLECRATSNNGNRGARWGVAFKVGFGVKFARKWVQLGHENGPLILRRHFQ